MNDDECLVNDSENIALVEDGVGGTIDGDLSAAVFGDENLVVDGYAEGDFLAVLVSAAGAKGAHDGLLGFLLGAVRQEKSSCCLALCFHSLYEYTLSDGFDHMCMVCLVKLLVWWQG